MEVRYQEEIVAIVKTPPKLRNERIVPLNGHPFQHISLGKGAL